MSNVRYNCIRCKRDPYTFPTSFSPGKHLMLEVWVVPTAFSSASEYESMGSPRFERERKTLETTGNFESSPPDNFWRLCQLKQKCLTRPRAENGRRLFIELSIRKIFIAFFTESSRLFLERAIRCFNIHPSAAIRLYQLSTSDFGNAYIERYTYSVAMNVTECK